jgi:hypothetical protein
VAGEDAQDTGREGLQRAKRWLELTTRVDQSWTHRDRPMAELLEFRWPHGSAETFSFDLGGKFRGESLDNQSFLAEVKRYRKEGDLPSHFRDFLAKCYVAMAERPQRCDHFLWVSWAPFQAQRWDEHTSVASVTRALLHATNRERTLGIEDEGKAQTLLDAERLGRVAERVWLITLNDKQEQLVLAQNHYLEVVKMITSERGI